MPRNFNYTDRKKINRDDITVRIHDDQSDLRFSVQLRLSNYDFPPQATVHAEAYRSISAQWKRFDMGRVGDLQSNDLHSLQEFHHSNGIRFRIKVTASGEHSGLLLGEADGITPLQRNQNEAPPLPLIDLDCRPLGGEIWKIEYPESFSARPILVMNDRIEDWSIRAKDPTFRALILPAVMRDILLRILVIEGDTGDEESDEDWREHWLRFSETLPNMSSRPDPLESGGNLSERIDILDWIDQAVGAFGLQAELTDQLIVRWNTEGQS